MFWTPAAFYAHVPHRGQMYDINVSLAKSGFDYFAGGQMLRPVDARNAVFCSAASRNNRSLFRQAVTKYRVQHQEYLEKYPLTG